MGEKTYNQQRESKKHKRRVQKITCSKCKAKIIVEDEIENGNISVISGIKFLECPQCGQEIII
jgi:ribosomal protein L44E